MIKKICLYCNEEFDAKVGKRLFCSREHFNAYRTEHSKENTKSLKEVVDKITAQVISQPLSPPEEPKKDIKNLTLGEILELSMKNGELTEKIELLENKLKAIHETSFLKNITSSKSEPRTEPQKVMTVQAPGYNLYKERNFVMLNGDIKGVETISKEAAMRLTHPVKP